MFHKSGFLWVMLGCVSLGCGQAVESLTIEQWAMALQEKDLNTLKLASSPDFNEKALRLEESLDDLEILNLPSGEPNVVKIEDISENEKKVEVEVGTRKVKLLYLLTRESGSKQWQVNDILVKQRQEGLLAQRSITQQMDLLLTVREFLTTWQGENRDAMLAYTTPKLKGMLTELPEPYLVDLSRQLTGKAERNSSVRPQAHMDEDIAVVRMQRPTGQVIMSFRLIEGNWLVDDLAMESPDPAMHIPSLQKTAIALKSGVGFLHAYNQQDRENLAKFSTVKFFESCLASADLSALSLPSAVPPPTNYKLSTHPHHAELVINEQDRVVRITLKRMDDPRQGDDKPISYLVEDATIYSLTTQQQVQLSSFFTSHAVLTLFMKSLNDGDIKMVRQLATPEFNDRVWTKLEGKTLSGFSFLGLGSGNTRILSTSFNGAVTNIDVMHGQQPMTYQLRNWNGRVLVHDVKLVGATHPASMKDTMDVMIPLREFAHAYQNNDIPSLRNLTSRDFNRVVWDQAERVPNIGASVSDYLLLPFHSMSVFESGALVTLGTLEQGARVSLTRMQNQFVVDDVLLIAGALPSQQVQVKQTLRNRMVLNSPFPQGRPQSPSPQLPAVPNQYADPNLPSHSGQIPQYGQPPMQPDQPLMQYPAMPETPSVGTPSHPQQFDPLRYEQFSPQKVDYSQPIEPASGQFPMEKSPGTVVPATHIEPQSFQPEFQNGTEEAFPELDVQIH